MKRLTRRVPRPELHLPGHVMPPSILLLGEFNALVVQHLPDTVVAIRILFMAMMHGIDQPDAVGFTHALCDCPQFISDFPHHPRPSMVIYDRLATNMGKESIDLLIGIFGPNSRHYRAALEVVGVEFLALAHEHLDGLDSVDINIAWLSH
ncbi:hypothetical protein T310_0414 [Rasamsonia emersonii CBS 393.64]|uniref:Uncharacterized protein n=1 Tax=Rasamsonia emersonii (strain ATCC 16479 / CBS 393.64 / IMI 116815) TaxID=1408163 RepID=A0A0F4Z4S7_RASE3|nr:hypothetical protein T310_0414 [Rasamsonia emersonii CBS 393.64]KKA25534.1 hypothetical protein T310_0414 [Rasamsonia emersonii CBS 393.64]